MRFCEIAEKADRIKLALFNNSYIYLELLGLIIYLRTKNIVKVFQTRHQTSEKVFFSL